MLIEFLVGAAIGAIIGAAVIGICECIKLAVNYFNCHSEVDTIKVVKRGSSELTSVMRSFPRINAAMQGEATGAVLLYENGVLTRYATVEKEFSEDFNGCSGYKVYRHDQETAHKIY